MSELYIGLMSGTSVDAIDVALVDFGSKDPQLIHTLSAPINAALREQITDLCLPGDNEIDKLGQLDIELGRQFAHAVHALLASANIPPSSVKAIGSHGQTVRHRPPKADGEPGYTLQIGDPNTIAELTGINTVADFRRRDMAAGGQGAPLAPLFHRALAPQGIDTIAFLNLGGIANLTLIHHGELICGFDTGPANGLMDAWIQTCKGSRFDAQGKWAASGAVNDNLLIRLRSHPFFSAPAPKSTGRETFNQRWLEQQLNKDDRKSPENIQRTLLELTATTIAAEIDKLPHRPKAIYCCGGGAHNLSLINRLGELCPSIEYHISDVLGIPADWLEACAFAWLAQQSIEQKALNTTAVTGAKNPVILGGLFLAR